VRKQPARIDADPAGGRGRHRIRDGFHPEQFSLITGAGLDFRQPFGAVAGNGSAEHRPIRRSRRGVDPAGRGMITRVGFSPKGIH